MKESILNVNKLKTNFYTYEGVVKALDGISLSLNKGDTLGIVGETGCGKSVTVLSILRLILPPGKIEEGEILYKLEENHVDLLKQPESFMRSIRGNEISMIFQEASSALNPVLTIGKQVSESFLFHRQEELCARVIEEFSKRRKDSKGPGAFYAGLIEKIYKRKRIKASSGRLRYGRYGIFLKKEAEKLAVNMLGSLGIPDPHEVIKKYPHELSGGMQQRVVIAMALACNPSILIADEPTSNLDVTIQAQILDLIEKLKATYQSSILFITHDLGVVSEVANKVIVLYAGTLVEFAFLRELFKNPLHPYTKALLRSVPKPGIEGKLESIQGNVPNLIDPPRGCRFHPRCPKMMEICKKEKPALYRINDVSGELHLVACFLYSKNYHPDFNEKKP